MSEPKNQSLKQIVLSGISGLLPPSNIQRKSEKVSTEASDVLVIPGLQVIMGGVYN